MNGATRTLVGVLSLSAALALSACQAGSNDPAAAGGSSAGGASAPASSAPSTGSAGANASSGAAGSGSSAPSASGTDAAKPSQSGGSTPAPSSSASGQNPGKGEVNAPEVKATGDAAKPVPKTLPVTYRKAGAAESKGVNVFLEGVATSGEPAKEAAGDNKKAAKAAKSALDDLAAGSALAELETEYVNNAVNGRTVTGKAVIKGTPRTVDLPGGTSRVFVCLDTSAVEVKVGKAIENPAVAAGTRTAVHVYDLRKTGSGFVVERHSFTNDPSC